MIPFSVLLGMAIMLMSAILWQLYRIAVLEEVKKILAGDVVACKKLLDNQSTIIGYYVMKYGEVTQDDFNAFAKKEKMLKSFPPTP